MLVFESRALWCKLACILVVFHAHCNNMCDAAYLTPSMLAWYGLDASCSVG